MNACHSLIEYCRKHKTAGVVDYNSFTWYCFYTKAHFQVLTVKGSFLQGAFNFSTVSSQRAGKATFVHLK